MTESLAYQQAMVLVERAYRAQVRGEVTEAMDLYNRSIALHPTAEAHTFLGWTYSMMGRYEEAIEQCEVAIGVDPTFGNPYNDIGAYLIEQGKHEDAIGWLNEALSAERYEPRHFPLVNLGRVYQQLGRYKTALDYFDQAIDAEPLYGPALQAKYALVAKLN